MLFARFSSGEICIRLLSIEPAKMKPFWVGKSFFKKNSKINQHSVLLRPVRAIWCVVLGTVGFSLHRIVLVFLGTQKLEGFVRALGV